MKLLKHLCYSSWEDNGQDTKTSCPWCSHQALEISNEIPHQFQCWHCKKTGNAYTLVQKYYEDLPILRLPEAVQLVRWKPGISDSVLCDLGLRRGTNGYVWPVKNTEGKVVALYRYDKEENTFFSTPRPCSLSLLGMEKLRPETPIWILEGHWDYAAFISNASFSGLSVLGLCGSSFPTRYLSILESRQVVFLADNDEAGRNGVHSLATRMKKASILPFNLKYLNWNDISIPSLDKIPDKFDLRDLVCELTNEQ